MTAIFGPVLPISRTDVPLSCTRSISALFVTIIPMTHSPSATLSFMRVFYLEKRQLCLASTFLNRYDTFSRRLTLDSILYIATATIIYSTNDDSVQIKSKISLLNVEMLLTMDCESVGTGLIILCLRTEGSGLLSRLVISEV